jgi:putative ABC transport system permease protein
VIGETARLAFRTLRGNVFRTVLTMLSVTIGAFSIVVMLSLAESGQKTLSRTIERIGGMRMVLWIPSEGEVQSARDRAVYDRGFTDLDLAALRRVPYLAEVASESTYGSEPVWATEDNRAKADIIGVGEGVLQMLGWDVSEGRAITDADGAERRRVAVLTTPLAETLFPDEELGAIVGQTVFVGRKPYVVAGVLEKQDMMGVNFGFSWETSVFLPQLTAEQRDGRPESARFFVGLTEDPAKNPTTVAMANAALLNNHHGVEDFQSLDFSGVLAQFYTFFEVLDLIVAIIASISLFAGGIGVMNIMLVSVTERVREIGIRKALGATRRDILWQFLIEACTLSLTGGLIGIGLALVVTTAANALIRHFQASWIGTYSVIGLALSLGVTTGIGLLFGAVPAWRAARLDVVECLRRS